MVLYQDEGGLLRDSVGRKLDQEDVSGLLSEKGDDFARKALEILGIKGDVAFIRSELEECRLLRLLLPEDMVEGMDENLLFGRGPWEGPLGPLMESAARRVREWSRGILFSAMEDVHNGYDGPLPSLEGELAKSSDSGPYECVFDAFTEKRLDGVIVNLSATPMPEPCLDGRFVSIYPTIGDLEKDEKVEGLPPGPWELGSEGAVLRMLLKLRNVFGVRSPINVVTDSRADAVALSSMGFSVHLTEDVEDGLERTLLDDCAVDLLGGPVRVVPEKDPEELTLQNLVGDALRGAGVFSAIAILRLSAADDRLLQYPETGYGLPCLTAWLGEGEMTAGRGLEIIRSFPGMPSEGGLEEALSAGELAMYSCELLEALRYQQRPGMYGKDAGFIPDRVLRELGLSFVDDTIPGCALIMGEAPEPGFLRELVRGCQNKGLLTMVADRTVEQLHRTGTSSGWDRMLYPLGSCTAIVHALNFSLRAALSFGNIAPGDRERLNSYLEKRPKVIVLHLGALGPLRSALAFAAVMHKAAIVTDIPVPEVPDTLERRGDPESMLQKGLEMRGIIIQSPGVDLPVPYGPAFEGEVIRKAETHVEMGGGRSTAFELLVTREEDRVNDGDVILLGDDIDDLPSGSVIPFAIIVEVYGKSMESDFEAVLERRVHQFLNYAEGLWHAGQRDMDWLRISEDAYDAGLRLHHIGKILVDRLKNEFGGIVSRIQVTLVTDEDEVQGLLEEAGLIYAQRDARMAGLRDDSVDLFYTCTLCQSFAPDHVCIISPERLGLCGAINWLDAKASNRITAHGPNQPVEKGGLIDAVKGEWEGVNRTVHSLSNQKVERVCMYSLMDAPMTSCGCFEAIVAMSSDMQSVVIVDREYAGMTPVGMRFSTLAGSIGGGRQTPGFLGIGRKYITSDKFLAAEGGITRIAWMPKMLKERLAEAMTQRADEAGFPDLLDKIADETVCDDAAGLVEWMEKVGHPALGMPPML